MNNKSNAMMKEILLLIAIISMMGLGTTHAETDSDDRSNSAKSSGSDSDDQAGPSPEDEGDDQSKDKEKKSAGGDSVPPDATLTSEAVSASTVGVSASMGVYGDFNNDGFDDLAIGVPGEDVDNIVDAGAVNVLYGSVSGLQTASPVNQYWHQDSASVEDEPETRDLFGSSLATGDFNNDGFDDLAIGVPLEDVGAGPIVDAGAVNVLYGSATGLQTVSPLDQFWHQNSADVEDVAETNDEFGSSLATGDFNNDGRDDLAIGVPLEDVGAGPIVDAGAVNVLYGSATGLQTVSPLDQFWNQDTAGVDDVAETNDEFGWSLATGDFNNDGRDDLAIGVLGESVGAGPILEAGAVNVLYGSATGLQTVSPLDQFWNQDSAGVEGIAEASDQFSNALA